MILIVKNLFIIMFVVKRVLWGFLMNLNLKGDIYVEQNISKINQLYYNLYIWIFNYSLFFGEFV